MTDEEDFVKLFRRFGMEWEQPEPTTTGNCYEWYQEAQGIVSWYFNHQGEFISMTLDYDR